MVEHTPLALPYNPQLVTNITHFARALRKAGLPIGTGRVIDAIRAVEAAGFTEKADFFWTLQACFVSRPEHRAVFAQVFRLYWRDPRYMEHMMAMMLPALRGVQEAQLALAQPPEEIHLEELAASQEVEWEATHTPAWEEWEVTHTVAWAAWEAWAKEACPTHR